MAKRILAIILTICLLAMAFPTAVSAQTPEHNALIKQINNFYYRAKANLNTQSLDNMCGSFVGYQLYYLGITTWAQTYNGSKFYDEYSRINVTSGGYDVRRYSGTQYSLEQALNEITHNGTQNAYNVILCFDWTKTAGSVGHVMLIHAIVNGIVYAVDNFTTFAGPEGRPMIAPIQRFAKEYEGWAMFEGAVEFGNAEYAYTCTSYAADMYVRAKAETVLLSQPAPDGSHESYAVRDVMQGERLAVTHLVQGEEKVNYYKVREGDNEYYIPCTFAQPIRLNTESLQTRGLTFETAMQVGDKGVLSGEIYSTGSIIGKVEYIVTDAAGDTALHFTHSQARLNHDLYDLNADLSSLEEGAYTVKLYATLWNYYDDSGIVKNQHQRVLVLEDTLLVGDAQPVEPKAASANVLPKHNWLLEDGVWHCYRNGEPRTGWYCYDGVDYYLKEDGSVTTGWANINGEDRFFSDTGAMRTGWLTEENGDVHYMLFNGVSAKGWREIDGETYYFDDNGILDEDK